MAVQHRVGSYAFLHTDEKQAARLSCEEILRWIFDAGRVEMLAQSGDLGRSSIISFGYGNLVLQKLDN